MASALMSSCQQQATFARPLRAAPSRVAAPARRMIVVKSSQDKPRPLQRAAEATLAAALAALVTTSGAAMATEGSIMPSRNPAEDKAARAFMDSRESKSPSVQNRSSDPNSGSVDPNSVRGAAQGRAPTPADEIPTGLQKSSIPGFYGSSSSKARKAAEMMDIGEVLDSITPATKKYAPARPGHGETPPPSKSFRQIEMEFRR